ncbi:hypothetical protein IMSAG049_00159 [Clostridiales bacterium]|nr:hypothetical protein IMSAG049_00159 [Clostridiales bacterium]
MKDIHEKITVVSGVLCIILLVKVFSLEREIVDMERSINNQLAIISSTVGDIPSIVGRELEQGNSLLSEGYWEFGEIDAETGMINVSLIAVPKEYTENTAAEICVNGDWHKMDWTDGRFSLEMDIELFEGSEVSDIRLTEDGITRNENISWIINPNYSVIPNVFADMSASWTYAEKCELSATIGVDINGGGTEDTMPDFSEVYLIYTENGEVAEKEKIQISYDTSNYSYAHGQYELEKAFELEQGKEYKIYIAMSEGNDGLVYVVPLYEYHLESNLTVAGGLENINEEADIYSKDGKILYRARRF